MMKSLFVLGVFGMLSIPAVAQTAPASPVAAPAPAAPQAQPQMVKKRVCEMLDDEDPYSRLGTRKICHTVMVKADPGSAPATASQAPAPQSPNNN